jgi:hypothetical protein
MKWILLVAMVVLSGCASASSSPPPVSSPSAAPSPSQVALQVLPPAKSLPVVALCSQQLIVDQYGNSGPLLCANGGLNVLAWMVFAPRAPHVLGAGPAASLGVVQTALCRDVNISHAAVLDELSAYELAAAYYGWSFSTDPTDILYSMSTCPR